MSSYLRYNNYSSNNQLQQFPDDSSSLESLGKVLSGVSNIIAAFKLAHAEAGKPFRIFIPRLNGLSSRFSLNEAAMKMVAYYTLQWKHLTCSQSTLLITFQEGTIPASGRYCVGDMDTVVDTVLQVDSFAGKEGAISIDFR